MIDMEAILAASPRRYSEKFSKLNWEKIAQTYLLESSNNEIFTFYLV